MSKAIEVLIEAVDALDLPKYKKVMYKADLVIIDELGHALQIDYGNATASQILEHAFPWEPFNYWCTLHNLLKENE